MAYTLIKNGLLVDTEWTRHSDILILGPKIIRVAASIDSASLPEDTHVIDATGLCVLPGIIDAHTHYGLVSRGTVTCDSFDEASKLASFGGVTTVVDFADDNKVSLSSSLDSRVSEMSGMAIDYALHQGVYKYREDIDEEMRALSEKGVGAIKIFTTYRDVGYLVENRDELKSIFKAAHDNKMIVCVHCEDNGIIEGVSENWKGTYLPKDHPDLRPAAAEAKAIEYVGNIAAELGMPVYIVHLSSEEGLESVRALRASGVKVTVETTPHYLFLDRSYLEGGRAPLYVMTPPLRTADDNKALREAVLNGEVQVIATDHCAFTEEQKLSNPDVRKTFPGIPGTEELLPLVHTFSVLSGKLSLSQVVNLVSTGPAKAFGLYPEKGSLKEGTDADIVLFDPDEAWKISSETTHSASGFTCYEGFNAIGRVKMTFLRGRLLMGDGVYLGRRGSGKFLEVGNA